MNDPYAPKNFCFARIGEGTTDKPFLPAGLPHEPRKAIDGTFILPVDPRYCDSELRSCRHCSSLYIEVEP